MTSGIVLNDMNAYVNKCIERFEGLLKSPVFLILSDDVAWCHENIGVFSVFLSSTSLSFGPYDKVEV